MPESNLKECLKIFLRIEWLWSSARTRKTGKGVIPDVYTMPVKLDNPQKQRIGIF